MASESTAQPFVARGGPSAAAAVAAVAGLLGAWIAAGSTGLLAHPLRHALSWVALGVVLFSAKLQRGNRSALDLQLMALAATIAAAVALVASTLPAAGVLAPAMLLLGVSCARADDDRRLLRAAAAAVAALTVYRVAYLSIPLVWLAADAVGAALGRAAGAITGRPLSLGATMAGLDFLVPMLYLAVLVPLRSACGWRTRLKRVLVAVGMVLAGHLLYLCVLSFTADLFARVPQLRPGEMAEEERPSASSLKWLLRDVLPWNVPALAAVIHALAAWIIGRRLGRPAEEASATAGGPQKHPVAAAIVAAVLLLLAVLTAAALPVVTTLCGHRPDIAGKKIVLYQEGFLNWFKPRHGDYGYMSAYMYGMLPTYLESLGAKPLISPELSADDLRGAAALVLIYPDKPWKPGQLQRIREFVEQGGSLLVLGEHTVWEKEEDGTFIDVAAGKQRSRFNDVLEPTGMCVRFDSTEAAIGGWLHSYDALAHPTTAGSRDEQNEFGVTVGGSVEVAWPARPLLVGRWGWADAGNQLSGDALLGDRRYDPGERLGDVVLAAEQPLGQGKIIAFSDTTSLVNGLTITAHPFTSRLFAYLLDGPSSPQQETRQYLGLGLVALLLGLLLWRPDAWRIAAAGAALAVSLTVCTAGTHRAWQVLPDGDKTGPVPESDALLKAGPVKPASFKNLAYIDASHANAFSRDGWGDDGVMGLCLTLMRNGYLTMLLPELTKERLDGAGLLLIIAPGREYTAAERRIIKEYVDGGGYVVYMVGYDRIGPSRELLADFGFRVGEPPPEKDGEDGNAEEPEPLGYFKAPYFHREGRWVYHVCFHAGWEVFCSAPEDKKAVLAAHKATVKRPVIVSLRYGAGRIAVIGDTCFALNKNLEYPYGSQPEPAIENAFFWRWFLPLLTGREPWDPPKPEPAEDAQQQEAP